MRTALLALIALWALAGPLACVPKKYIAIEDVPKVNRLKDLMDAQATLADPQFDKIGDGAYGDDDYRAFGELARFIGASSVKLKDFTHGAEFDAFAERLGAQGAALSSAAAARDRVASSGALAGMKQVCKECHKKYK